MGNGVDTAGGGQAAGRGHMEVRVDDGHLGQQLVIGQGILDARALIGDNGEGRYLAARAGGGGDGDEVGLFAHPGEGVHALADIHEAHGHIHKVALGMLVHHPHDLGRVHGAAAAQGDDAVGREIGHLLGASLGAGQGGIGRDVKERGVLDAHFVQLVGNRLGIAVMI